MSMTWDELEERFRRLHAEAPEAFIRFQRDVDETITILEEASQDQRHSFMTLFEIAGAKLSELNSPTFGRIDPGQGGCRFWYQSLRGRFMTSPIESLTFSTPIDQALTQVGQKSAELCLLAKAQDIVELTRFRGHLSFWMGGFHDGTSTVPAGVSAANDRAGPLGSHA